MRPVARQAARHLRAEDLQPQAVVLRAEARPATRPAAEAVRTAAVVVAAVVVRTGVVAAAVVVRTGAEAVAGTSNAGPLRGFFVL